MGTGTVTPNDTTDVDALRYVSTGSYSLHMYVFMYLFVCANVEIVIYLFVKYCTIFP